MGDKGRYLAVDRCPIHGHMAISINNDVGGTRLTNGACCGTWGTVKQWPLDDTGILRIIAHLEEYLPKEKRHTSALTTLRESITLAAAPLGITGELGEVVQTLGDKCERLVDMVNRLQDQLLTAREQGRREVVEEAGRIVKATLDALAPPLTGHKRVAVKGEDVLFMLDTLHGAVKDLSAIGTMCEWVVEDTSELRAMYNTDCNGYHEDRLPEYLDHKVCPRCHRPLTIKEG